MVAAALWAVQIATPLTVGAGVIATPSLEPETTGVLSPIPARFNPTQTVGDAEPPRLTKTGAGTP